MNDAAGLGLGGIQKRAGLTLEKPKCIVSGRMQECLKERRNSERDQRCF